MPALASWTTTAVILTDLVAASDASHLLEMPGIGAVNAAVILTAWSHHGRIHSEAAFAAMAGTCPIPASSGNTTRHRLNLDPPFGILGRVDRVVVRWFWSRA